MSKCRFCGHELKEVEGKAKFAVQIDSEDEE
jgi:hypothetical protein